MKARPKLLLLGMDAGAHEHFLEWCRTGVLPNLQRLVANGLVGRTRNVPAVFVQATWPSFYTGNGPARHGIHCWEQLKLGTYENYRAYTPDLVQTAPFWDRMSAAGKRVAILDIPQSRPSPNINGVQLVEWGAHDANHGFRTSPESLAAEVLERFGRHPHVGLCDDDRKAGELAHFRDDLVRGIAIKTAVTKHFLAQEDWDFFAQIFTETHCIGHQAWHLHDPTHPRFSAEERAQVGDPVRDVAVGIDRAIGEILAEVDERTTVVVMACHGMTCKYVPQFMLADILVKLGVAKRPVGAPPPPLPPSLRRTVDPILAWGWHHTPPLARRWLEPLRHRAHALVQQPARVPIDRAAGKCFPLNNNSTHGGIRVNVVGREPDGKVRPGAEFDAFVDELSRDLLEIVNVETGRRIVNRVLRKTDLFDSEHTAHFPDLFVEWVGAEPVHAIRSPKIGRIDREYSYCRTGEHVQSGIFIASGPGIAPGRLSREVSILDMAPTFCDALGVDCDGLDGTPIAEIADAVKMQRSARSASTSVPERPHLSH